MAAKRKSSDRRGDEIKAGDEKPYRAGYGRPPLETRFKPNQSGNPKGRPGAVRWSSAMSESNRSGGTHARAVGYKRPPVNRQFKPGQSGNPKGRPKGRKNFKTIFVEVLSKKVKVRDKNGTRTMSKLEAMIEVMANKALAGDPHAFARIVQIAEKHEVFTSQPEARIDTSAYDILMRRLEEMGYDTGRRPSASVAPRAKLAAE